MTAIDGFGPFCEPPRLGAAGERPFRRLETVAARSRLIAPFLSLLLHSAALAALVVSVGIAGNDGEEPAIDVVEVSLVAPSFDAPITPPTTTDVALPVAPEPSEPPEAAVPVDVAPVAEPAVEVAALPPPEPPPPEARPDALGPVAPIEGAPAPAALAPPVVIERPAPIASPPPAKPKAVRAPTAAPKSPTPTSPAAATPRPPQTATAGGANRTPAAQGAAGRGDGERDALARYLASVRARIVSQRRAPLGADRGRVEVRFTIGPDGSLDGIRAGGTVEEVLESEALRIVRRASPVSPIPAEVGRTALAMTVTIDFR